MQLLILFLQMAELLEFYYHLPRHYVVVYKSYFSNLYVL